jgi:uncharacterized protein (DUF58 family)
MPDARAVRRLQISCSRLATAIFAGEYRSAFRGRGIEFDEVREYEAGDDIRTIDWNVTARQGRPFIKRFVEERELTLHLLLDRSPSMDFGTVRATKLDTAIEACALLAFAALRSHDRMSLLTYGDGEIRYLPPGKGKRHTLQLIRTAMTPANIGRETAGLAEALDHFRRVVRGRALSCVLSDFIAPLPTRSLAAVAARHDTVAFVVSDLLEHELPEAGLFRLADAEGSLIRVVDSGSSAVRDSFRRMAALRQGERRKSIADTGVALLELATQAPPLYSLLRFFRSRQRGRRR